MKLREGEALLEANAKDLRLAAFRDHSWTWMTPAFMVRREILYRTPGSPTQRLEPDPEPEFE